MCKYTHTHTIKFLFQHVKIEETKSNWLCFLGIYKIYIYIITALKQIQYIIWRSNIQMPPELCFLTNIVLKKPSEKYF